MDEDKSAVMSKHDGLCPTCGQKSPEAHTRILKLLQTQTPAVVGPQVGLSERQVQRIAVAYGVNRPRGNPRLVKPATDTSA